VASPEAGHKGIMPRAVKSVADILSLLSRAPPKLRRVLLESLDAKTVYAICEICHNVAAGAVPLSPEKKSKLARHKTVIRRLAQRGEGWKTKKTVVQQRGGAFLPVLLGTVLSSLIGAFSK